MKTIKLFLLLNVFSPFIYCQKSSDSGTWGHFGYDNCYTSYNPNETTIDKDNVNKLKRLWGIGCDDGMFSVIYRSPAIYDGRLYTSGAGEKLSANDISSGTTLWKFGNNNTGLANQPSISISGSLIYLEGSMPSYMYWVNAMNGTQIWKAPIGFNLYGASNVITVDEDNELVYLIETEFSGGKFYAINLNDGKIAWYKSIAKDNLEIDGDFVLYKDSVVYVPARIMDGPSSTRQIIGINVITQEEYIKYDQPTDDIPFAYSICNDKLVVAYKEYFATTGTIASYNIGSKTVVWTKQVEGEITGSMACNTDKSIIYVPTNPYLYALNALTGEEIWRYTGYNAIYTPSIANGIVYFISATSMWALDEDTGEELFYFDLGYEGEETSQVAIADGKLYFSGNGGTCDLFVLGFDSSSPVKEDVFSPEDNIIRNIYMQNNSVLVIELECSPCTSFTIEMYDMLGKVIKNISFNEYQDHKISTDFTNGPGMYICLIKTKSGTYAKKFVVGN